MRNRVRAQESECQLIASVTLISRRASQLLGRRRTMAGRLACGHTVKCWLLIPALMSVVELRASEWLPGRLYDVTIETGMPHLEENLRYTTTHRRSCISLEDLATQFPILDHPSLAGCTLGGAQRNEHSVTFGLI